MKVLFFDIDGTLLDFGKDLIASETLEAMHLAQKNGHKIVICSGRCVCQLPGILSQFDFDGMVSSAGANVEYQGKSVFHRPIGKEIMQKMLSFYEENHIPYLLQANDVILASHESCMGFCRAMADFLGNGDEETLRRKFGIQLVEENFLEHLGDYADILTTAYVESPIGLRDVQQFFAPELVVTGSSINKTEDSAGEVTLAGINKATGMEALLSYLGLKREDSIAFGDGPNDLEMLSYAGIGVAMGNASEQVKQCADMITRSVAEDGVGYALRKLQLI